MFDNPNVPDRVSLTIEAYSNLAHRTNRMKPGGLCELEKPMLGFFGEAGSLLSAVKKRTRDDLAIEQYTLAVREEVGDFLWYLSLICKTANVPLVDVARRAAKVELLTTGEPRFTDLDEQFALRNRPPIDRLIPQLIGLAGDVGKFVAWHAENRASKDREIILGHLSPVMRHLVRACAAAGVKLQDAAVFNLCKIYDRWPEDRSVFPDHYDAFHADLTERFPRQLEIRIEQRTKRGKNYVFQTCNSLNIGDPLTDNIGDADHYRFHDVFHYAYMAVLGWSPVTRALFKLKRKSEPSLDENQDGARAILIEEGLSALIFNHAKLQRYFEGVSRDELSFDLLKTVRDFVGGYEVETAPLWLWEDAILAGYKCFRFLKEHKAGLVRLDMNKRTITIEKLPR